MLRVSPFTLRTRSRPVHRFRNDLVISPQLKEKVIGRIKAAEKRQQAGPRETTEVNRQKRTAPSASAGATTTRNGQSVAALTASLTELANTPASVQSRDIADTAFHQLEIAAHFKANLPRMVEEVADSFATDVALGGPDEVERAAGAAHIRTFMSYMTSLEDVSAPPLMAPAAPAVAPAYFNMEFLRNVQAFMQAWPDPDESTREMATLFDAMGTVFSQVNTQLVEENTAKWMQAKVDEFRLILQLKEEEQKADERLIAGIRADSRAFDKSKREIWSMVSRAAGAKDAVTMAALELVFGPDFVAERTDTTKMRNGDTSGMWQAFHASIKDSMDRFLSHVINRRAHRARAARIIDDFGTAVSEDADTFMGQLFLRPLFDAALASMGVHSLRTPFAHLEFAEKAEGIGAQTVAYLDTWSLVIERIVDLFAIDVAAAVDGQGGITQTLRQVATTMVALAAPQGTEPVGGLFGKLAVGLANSVLSAFVTYNVADVVFEATGATIVMATTAAAILPFVGTFAFSEVVSYLRLNPRRVAVIGVAFAAGAAVYVAASAGLTLPVGVGADSTRMMIPVLTTFRTAAMFNQRSGWLDDAQRQGATIAMATACTMIVGSVARTYLARTRRKGNMFVLLLGGALVVTAVGHGDITQLFSGWLDPGIRAVVDDAIAVSGKLLPALDPIGDDPTLWAFRTRLADIADEGPVLAGEILNRVEFGFLKNVTGVIYTAVASAALADWAFTLASRSWHAINHSGESLSVRGVLGNFLLGMQFPLLRIQRSINGVQELAVQLGPDTSHVVRFGTVSSPNVHRLNLKARMRQFLEAFRNAPHGDGTLDTQAVDAMEQFLRENTQSAIRAAVRDSGDGSLVSQFLAPASTQVGSTRVIPNTLWENMGVLRNHIILSYVRLAMSTPAFGGGVVSAGIGQALRHGATASDRTLGRAVSTLRRVWRTELISVPGAGMEVQGCLSPSARHNIAIVANLSALGFGVFVSIALGKDLFGMVQAVLDATPLAAYSANLPMWLLTVFLAAQFDIKALSVQGKAGNIEVLRAISEGISFHDPSGARVNEGRIAAFTKELAAITVTWEGVVTAANTELERLTGESESEDEDETTELAALRIGGLIIKVEAVDKGINDAFKAAHDRIDSLWDNLIYEEQLYKTQDKGPLDLRQMFDTKSFDAALRLWRTSSELRIKMRGEETQLHKEMAKAERAYQVELDEVGIVFRKQSV